MRRTYGDWDFGGNSILRVRIHPGETFYGTPEPGQVMYHMGLKGLYVWDGDNWIACSISGATLDSLADVDTTTLAPMANGFLGWNPQVGATPGYWGPKRVSLAILSDVNIAGAANGQILKRVGGVWTAQAAPLGLPLGGAAGQLLAKNSETDGDVHWIDATGTRLRIGAFVGGKPDSDEIVMSVLMVDDSSFPIAFAGSLAQADVAATASTTFTVEKNGVEVGSFTFAASATTATFSAPAATPLVVGDRVTVVAPTTADATLADISFTLKGA